MGLVQGELWKVRKVRLCGCERGKVNCRFDRERMAYGPMRSLEWV